MAAEETDRSDIAVVICRHHIEDAVGVEVPDRHVRRPLPGRDRREPASNDPSPVPIITLTRVVAEAAVGGDDVLSAVAVEVGDGQPFGILVARVDIRERLERSVPVAEEDAEPVARGEAMRHREIGNLVVVEVAHGHRGWRRIRSRN